MAELDAPDVQSIRSAKGPTDPARIECARYWAFISYSHQDRAWAAWLHKALEIYHIPRRLRGRVSVIGTVPRKLFPIFRDREELSTSSDLGASIKDALADSRYLIVVCSPDAVRSKWVNEEIRQFKALGREDRVRCLIVRGEPGGANGAAEGECFPEALRHRVATDGSVTGEQIEPIAADVRPSKDGKSDARLKLIAGMIGVEFDELRARERQRRNRRRLGVAATAIVVLGAIAGVYLYQERAKERLANESRIEQLQEAGRSEYLAGLPGRAAVYLTHAYGRGDDRPSLRYLLGRSMASLEGQAIQLEAHTAKVSVVAFSPDGKHLVSAGEDGLAKVWDVNDTTASLARVLQSSRRDGGSAASIGAAAFSHDGSLLVTGGSGRTTVWSVARGESVASGPLGDYVHEVEFSRDDSRVLAAALGGSITIFDATTGFRIADISGHRAPVVAAHATFSPDGNLVLAGGGDGTVRLWDAGHDDREVRRLWTDAGEIVGVAWSADGTRAAALSQSRTVKLWETGAWRELGSAQARSLSVDGVALSPTAARLLIVGTVPDLVELTTRQPAPSLGDQHSGDVNTATFGLSGDIVATASSHGQVAVWDAATGARLALFSGSRVRLKTVAVGGDGDRWVATGDDEGIVRLWDWKATNQGTRDYSGKDDTVHARAVPDDDGFVGTFCASGTPLARSSGGVVEIRDTESARLLSSFELGNTVTVFSGAFSPDCRSFALATNGPRAAVFEVATGTPLFGLDPAETPDQWSTEAYSDTYQHPQHAPTVAWSPAGHLVAAALRTHAVELWNVSTHLRERTLQHAGVVSYVAFSKSGKRLLGFGPDKPVVSVWEVDGPRVAELGASRARVDGAALSTTTASSSCVTTGPVSSGTSHPARASRSSRAMTSASTACGCPEMGGGSSPPATTRPEVSGMRARGPAPSFSNVLPFKPPRAVSPCTQQSSVRTASASQPRAQIAR